MTHEENIIFPDTNGFRGTVLDEYLAAGFYRMQHFMFTTRYTQLEINGEPNPVFWLRTDVTKITTSKTMASIHNRCKQFQVQIIKAAITPETEELYSIYKGHIDFNASDDCSSYLECKFIDPPFDSRMIEIRDGSKLVAVGYFDQGENAIAGILNFYHPEYKHCSLGKYLMLLKIQYALENNIQWYYTGYISTAMNKFDYKIFPDKEAMEVYLPVEKKWIQFSSIEKNGLIKYLVGSYSF